MSLNLALSSAVSSILSVQQQMAVASNNISNANTKGYSKESVTVQASVTAGVGTGVVDTGITTNVDKYLLQSIISANTSSSAASTTNDYYQSLEQALGSVTSSSTGGNDLSSQLSSLESALSALASNPNQASLKTTVVTDLDNLCSNLRSTSSTVQSLRSQADEQISETVADANTQLTTIKTLNSEIAQAKALGQSTVSYEDQRNTALESLSGDLGITYFVDTNDQVQIYTSGGQTLLDGSVQRTLSYTPATTITASTTYPSGGISGITLAGTDVTTQLEAGGGKIGALIEQRDVDLPKVQSELNNLASTLSTTLNTISNQGSTYPATTPLTGSNTTALSASTTVSVASGTTVRVALTDSTGAIAAYADVDLTGCTTIGNVLSAINGATYKTASGTTIGTGVVSASLNSSGQLTLSAASGYSAYASDGVSVATSSGSFTTGSSTASFSSYFHLNDMISGGTSATSIAVSSTLLSTPSALATSKLSTTSLTGLTQSDTSTTSIANQLTNALINNQTFSAAGNLSTISGSFSSYATDIISDVATKASSASDTDTTKSTTLSTLKSTMSSQAGVNTDEENASLVALQSLYQASAKVISTVQTMFTALLDAVKTS